MSTTACKRPADLAMLIAYWLDELGEAVTEQLEEHLLGCGACSRRLHLVVDLAGGIRSLVGAGAVHAVVSAGFVRRLRAQGLRLREYRAPRNGSVYCSVHPEDDLTIARLAAPLRGLQRVDLLIHGADARGPWRLRDVPFDPQGEEIVLLPNTAELRTLPAHTTRFELLAVDAGGERRIGEYIFHHSPAAR